MNTVQHAETLTKNKPLPKYARTIATTKAAIPAMGYCVASIMAGKVITANVT